MKSQELAKLKNINHTLTEIKNEFPSVGNNDFQKFKEDRGYNSLKNKYWSINEL